MAGRFSVASILSAGALALLATPVFAADLDRDCTREGAGHLPVARLLTTVDSIFDGVNARAAENPSAELTTMEVVMVRIVDGKPVLACVDTREAANRFLTASTDKLAAKTAQDK